MKFLVSIVLTALLSLSLGLFLPWWSVALAAFLVAVFLRLGPGWSFLAGFIGVFALWTLLILSASSANEHLLARKMSQVILRKESPALLIVISATIGALVAGLGALSGSLFRALWSRH